MEWGEAKWIWDGGEPAPRNKWVYFRKEFEIPKVGEDEEWEWTAQVTADSYYVLEVNEDYTGHGPARSQPPRMYVDVIDFWLPSAFRDDDSMSEEENELKHCVGVHVWSYGEGTAGYIQRRAGLLLRLVGTCGDKRVEVVTDSSWQCFEAPMERDLPRTCIQLAYPVIFDGRKEPKGWGLFGFDASGWSNAVELGEPGIEPWPVLEERDIPMPSVAGLPRRPNNFIGSFGIERVIGPTDRGEDGYLVPPAVAMKAATKGAPLSLEWEYGGVIVPPQTGAQGTSLYFDFGQEVSGFPEVNIEGSDGYVDIGYCERIQPDGTLDPDRDGVHYADRLYCPIEGPRCSINVARAFRYMRIDVFDNSSPIRIHRAGIQSTGYPVELKGAFLCDDDELNRIWEVGRYTATLCMDDAYMDCPWRERAQWLGDARVEALVAYYAFGDYRLMRKAIRQYAQSQTAEGFVMSCAPSQFLDFQGSVLPTFSCIWVSSIWEYYQFSGDDSIFAEVWPVVKSQFEAFRRFQGENGLVGGFPYWNFVDWTPVHTHMEGQYAPVNCFLVDALRVAEKLGRHLGDNAAADEYKTWADQASETINRLFWREEVGAYHDGINRRNEEYESVSQQTNALCTIFDIAPPERAASAMDYVMNPNNPVVPVLTPYFSFYLLRALYKLGRLEEALNFIRANWGGMLKLGATTFWEHYEPKNSFCHAWSSGPTCDLLQRFMGIAPTSPGWKTFEIVPNPCGLQFMNTTVPTPQGDILAYYSEQREEDGTVKSITLSALIPENTTATGRLLIPQSLAGKPITHNGERAKAEFEWTPGKHLLQVG